MTTPRGGQYQIALPDGSRVWLNAESSITYPTAFVGKERRVSITGEAYFEVAKDIKKKFIVAVASPVSRLPTPDENKNLEIEVLGTHFNVNTYKEEPTINTTLLEGSVKISLSNTDPNNKQNSVHTSLTLKPGQQGQWNPRIENLSLADRPDIDKVMAWKNGIFDFSNASLEEVMRLLVRWYDVEVVYEGKIPQMTFGGQMGRDLNLSQVVKALSVMGVNFRIEGKKLIVTQ